MDAHAWLIRNYGPRCTLVCAASVLQWLGARSPSIAAMETATGFRDGYGPPVTAYLGGHSALDRGIECAAALAGLEVRSRTRVVVRFAAITRSLDRGVPAVLNCFRAPSRQWSHSILAVDYALAPRRLLTLDPNDARERWLTWLHPTTGWVCTATFIEPVLSSPNTAAIDTAAIDTAAIDPVVAHQCKSTMLGSTLRLVRRNRYFDRGQAVAVKSVG